VTKSEADCQSTSPFRVALTIDAEFADRPTEPGATARLFDVLADDGIPAAVFIQGRWVIGEPALARRVAGEGHLVANHSHHHAPMTLLTGRGIVCDVLEAEQAIVDATGVNPRPWFRCPFGAGADDPELIGRLGELGYREVDWHVNPEDWDPPNSAVDIEQFVVDGVLAQGDGAVVLLHAWPDPTAAVVRAIVPRLIDEGATFVGVDDLAVLPSFLPVGSGSRPHWRSPAPASLGGRPSH
jgi:peptidoglycan/xylan/chitin deacetylase (PgdA/CDA1 family)